MNRKLGYGWNWIPCLTIALGCTSDDHSLGRDRQTQTDDGGGPEAGGPEGGPPPRLDAGAAPGTGGSGGGPTGTGGRGNPATGGASNPGTGGQANEAECEALGDQIEDFERSNRGCESDGDCQLVDLPPDPCCGGRAINRDVSQSAIDDKHAEWTERYKELGCDYCGDSICEERTRTYCDTSIGACMPVGDNCEDPYYAEAAALVADYNQCDEDADCEVFSLEDAECFAGCGHGLNPSTDVAQLHADLAELSDKFRAECNACAIPDCELPTGAICNDAHRCELTWPSCESHFYDEMDALVDELNDCSEDAECEIVNAIGADCVMGCGVALNTTLPGAGSSFNDQARQISERLIQACAQCTVPDCLPPTGTVCNTDSKCEIVWE